MPDSAARQRDYTAEIISMIAPGYSTRQDAAVHYGWGIKYHQDEIDWPKLNAAIIERWSASGLEWIKRRAWKINEQIAAKHGSDAMNAAPVPEQLTRCCECGLLFPEPVANWSDYFAEVEDASFACESCAEREGYPDAE